MKEEIIEVNATAVHDMVNNSPGWRELERFITANIQEVLSLLRESGENDERNRGRIDAFEAILNWPSVVEQEAHVQKLETQEQPGASFNENENAGVYTGSRRILSDWIRSKG